MKAEPNGAEVSASTEVGAVEPSPDRSGGSAQRTIFFPEPAVVDFLEADLRADGAGR